MAVEYGVFFFKVVNLGKGAAELEGFRFQDCQCFFGQNAKHYPNKQRNQLQNYADYSFVILCFPLLAGLQKYNRLHLLQGTDIVS